MSHSELHIRRELQSAINSGNLGAELDLRRSLKTVGDRNVDTSINTSDSNADTLGETRDFQSVGADLINRFAEPALSIASGAVAAPIAGFAGGVQAINPFAEKGAGLEAVKSVEDALTMQPQTEAGKRGLEAVQTTLEPVSNAISRLKEFIGLGVDKATGSEFAGAVASTIPDLILEIFGFAGGKLLVKTGQRTGKSRKESNIQKTTEEAVPSADQIQDVAREVYKEIDNLGISIQPKTYQKLVKKIQIEARRMGLDKDVTPKSFKAIERFIELESPSLTDIDIVRKVAQNAAKDLGNLGDAAIGATIIDTVDDFLDKVKNTELKKPIDVDVDIGKLYKTARDLWGRSRRSELLEVAFEKARLQASGFENGIRTQFRQILNNKKQRRFFKKDEILAMEKVVLGDKKTNFFRLIGKLGFNIEGGSSQIIGGSIGVGAGATAGGFIGGPGGATVGAVLVPLIGQVSKVFAERMTRGSAEFADQVIRAGADAKKITRAYIRNTPKSKRTSQELSELLMRNDIDLSQIPDLDIARDAAQIAVQNRGALVGTLAAGEQ